MWPLVACCRQPWAERLAMQRERARGERGTLRTSYLCPSHSTHIKLPAQDLPFFSTTHAGRASRQSRTVQGPAVLDRHAEAWLVPRQLSVMAGCLGAHVQSTGLGAQRRSGTEHVVEADRHRRRRDGGAGQGRRLKRRTSRRRREGAQIARAARSKSKIGRAWRWCDCLVFACHSLLFLDL